VGGSQSQSGQFRQKYLAPAEIGNPDRPARSPGTIVTTIPVENHTEHTSAVCGVAVDVLRAKLAGRRNNHEKLILKNVGRKSCGIMQGEINYRGPIAVVARSKTWV